MAFQTRYQLVTSNPLGYRRDGREDADGPGAGPSDTSPDLKMAVITAVFQRIREITLLNGQIDQMSNRSRENICELPNKCTVKNIFSLRVLRLT